jgi:hypothetical protein
VLPDEPADPPKSPSVHGGTEASAAASQNTPGAEARRQRYELFHELLRSWRELPEVPAEDERSFVEQHLQAAIPRGWVANFRVARESADRDAQELHLVHHEWKVMRETDAAEETASVTSPYYVAFLSSRSELVFVYGNDDIGPLAPHHFYQRAMVIPLRNLGVMLPFIFARPDEFPPNRYGLS